MKTLEERCSNVIFDALDRCFNNWDKTDPENTFSKSTLETLEKSVKHVQN